MVFSMTRFKLLRSCLKSIELSMIFRILSVISVLSSSFLHNPLRYSCEVLFLSQQTRNVLHARAKLAAFVATVAVVSAGLPIYFKKRKR